MSWLDNQIQPGEQVIYDGRPAWIAYIKWVMIGALTSVIGIGIIILVWVLIDRNSRKYAVTNFRIIHKTGIISEDIKSASISHITAVRMERGFLGLLLNYGDMKIDSAGTGSEQEFEWVNIDKPNDLKNLIEKARNPAA